jgi:RNA polymerase sigma-70 factor (ECF subfamily)
MTKTLDNRRLEELLQRCAARDAAALRELYEHTASQLLAVLLRILHTRAAAEDALQDVFIRIWQQAGQYEEFKGRAISWMVSIARYRAIDLVRAARPMVVLEVAELAGAEQLQVEGPADRAEFGATRAALQRCLELLAQAQRHCVQLAYQHGMTQEQIAQQENQPLGTVKTWIRRGLQSLRTCMET